MAQHSSDTSNPSPPRETPRGGRARSSVRLAIGALGIFVAGTAYWTWRSGQPQQFVVPPDPPPVVAGAQTFRQPEQAAAYSSAAAAGHERSLRLLEQALQQTERQHPVDAPAAARLRSAIRERKAQLAKLAGASAASR